MTIRVYVQELCSSFCSFADIFPGVVLYFCYVMFYQCILLVWLLLVLPSGNHNFCFEILAAIVNEIICEVLFNQGTLSLQNADTVLRKSKDPIVHK